MTEIVLGILIFAVAIIVIFVAGWTFTRYRRKNEMSSDGTKQAGEYEVDEEYYNIASQASKIFPFIKKIRNWGSKKKS